MTEQTHSRLRALADPDHLPALSPQYLRPQPALGLVPLNPAPRSLLLHGSLRERSYSRLGVEETARLLQLFGCETRIFDPSDLPLPDQIADDDHPAVEELRQHSIWSEGQVWCSPERHGQITGIMKAQRSEEHPSELQSLIRNSYAVFCWEKKTQPMLQN